MHNHAPDEELHLLASCRGLLARNDWLGLDHTKPLRIGFPTAVDKDRVGKRRKIKKSSETRTKAARPRLMTPLFEERLEPNAYHMSGALPPEHDDHIEVRVGTSAFETQSRPSRRSDTSRNVSLGAHSTALSHLSEESMLLGADGDSFDADQVEVPAYTRDLHEAHEVLARSGSFDSRQYELEEVDRYSSRAREYSLVLDGGPELQQYRAEINDGDSSSISSPHHVAEPAIGKPSIDNSAAPESEFCTTGDPQQANDFETMNRDVLVGLTGMAAPAKQNPLDAELDAEQEWRHLMGIVTQSESLTSRKALDSSSEHITTSESMHRVTLGDFQHGAGISNVIADPKQPPSSLNQAHPAQAPDILVVGTQPPLHVPEDAEDNTDNEALWREFIIGSQDSESGDELHSAWQRSREKMRQSSEQPQSLQVSGLGTSDQATRGGATVCSPNLFAARVADDGESLEHDTESIEEFQLDDTPRPSSPPNFHATLTRRLDPRRFKVPKDIGANTTRRENQQHGVLRRRSSRRFTKI